MTTSNGAPSGNGGLSSHFPTGPLGAHAPERHLSIADRHLIYSRLKHCNVTPPVDKRMVAHALIEDMFVSAEVRVTFELPHLEIVAIEGEMRRAHYDHCTLATAVLQRVVGTRIQAGLTRLYDHLLWRDHGCMFLSNLVLESCHSALQAINRLRRSKLVDKKVGPEESLRQWLQANPHLVDSCVSFSRKQPVIADLLSRPTANPAQPQPGGSTMVLDPRAALAQVARETDTLLAEQATNAMLIWSRTKSIAVQQIDEQTVRSKGFLMDLVHGMECELEVRFPEREIRDVSVGMLRYPRFTCPGALPSFQSAIGRRIGPGVTALFDEILGRQGCPHLTNLTLESCHAVLQSELALLAEQARREGLSQDDLRRDYLEDHPELRNSCLSYSDDSPVLQKLGVNWDW